jgi:transcriptional regulator with XRE-family HTH domain
MSQPVVSDLLRSLREGAGKSLREAAGDIGVAPSHLSRLERGQASSSPELRERTAEYYGVNPELIDLAAGKIPADIVEILMANPKLLDQLRSKYSDTTE